MQLKDVVFEAFKEFIPEFRVSPREYVCDVEGTSHEGYFLSGMHFCEPSAPHEVKASAVSIYRSRQSYQASTPFATFWSGSFTSNHLEVGELYQPDFGIRAEIHIGSPGHSAEEPELGQMLNFVHRFQARLDELAQQAEELLEPIPVT